MLAAERMRCVACLAHEGKFALVNCCVKIMFEVCGREFSSRLNITGIAVLQEFVPPTSQPPVWSEGGMVYADMSQPPPVQMPSASGMT